MASLLLPVQIAVALVLVSAATGKVLRPDDFRYAIRASGLPDHPIADVVPAIELALGVALVVAPLDALPIAFGFAIALFALFTLWIVWVMLRKIRVRCGCFGAASVELSHREVLRNIVLVLLAAAGLTLAFSTDHAASVPTLWKLAAAIPVASAVMLILALRRVRSQLAFSSGEAERLYNAPAPEGGT